MADTGDSPISSYRIVEHDPAWAKLFEAERHLLIELTGLSLDRIEHIGSTAVPGLGAKPVIDLMVGVDDVRSYEAFVPVLERAGYLQKGETVPGTLYNRKAEPWRVNAHLTRFGGAFWIDRILFRDHLVGNGEDGAAYEALKRRLAAELGTDPAAYNLGKEPFILATVEKVRKRR